MVYSGLGSIRVVQLWPRVRIGGNLTAKHEMGQ